MRFILPLSLLFLISTAPGISEAQDVAPESAPAEESLPSQPAPEAPQQERDPEEPLNQPASEDSQEEPPVEAEAETPPAPARPSPEPTLQPAPEPETDSADETLFKEPVRLDGVAYFTLYQKGGEAEDLRRQAQEASDKLGRALANTTIEAAAESLRFERTSRSLAVYISELQIVNLKPHHLEAAGLLTFEQYEKEIEGQILKGLSERLNKAKWQQKAKTFFLTFFFLAVGLLILGQLSRLFERAEVNLLERKERFQSISLFSETLIKGQTVGAFLTLALVVGRVLAYLFVVIITLLAVLSQFEGSQSALSDFFGHLAELAVQGLQALVEAIPSILLAMLLILGLYFGLRVVGLYLRSLSIGRIRFKALPPYRLPVARFWLPLILILIFIPFIIATLLTVRFSSLEIGVMSFGIIVLLGFLPLFIGAAIGSYVIWNGHLKEGQWVEVGPFHGEVTQITLFDITIVPEDGGVVRIPMIYFMGRPSHVRPEIPKFEITFTLRKMGSLEDTLQRVRDLFPDKWNAEVICQSVNQSEVKVRVRAGKFESRIKSQTMQILSDACDSKAIELTSDFVEEIVH